MTFAADRPEGSDRPLSGTDVVPADPVDSGPQHGTEHGAVPAPQAAPQPGAQPAGCPPAAQAALPSARTVGGAAAAATGPAQPAPDATERAAGPATDEDAEPSARRTADRDPAAAGTTDPGAETSPWEEPQQADGTAGPEEPGGGADSAEGARPAGDGGGSGRDSAGDMPPDDEDPDFWNDGLIARRAPERATPRAARSTNDDWQDWQDWPSVDTTGITDGADSGQGRANAAPRDPASAAAARAAGGRPRRPVFNRALRTRLDALRELAGLSRARLDSRELTEAGHVLDESVARHRLSLDHTVVALAGASGSGKSTLFNALAGATLSEAGVCRPTTSEPVACTWSEGADGLLDRLGVPPRLRRRMPTPHDRRYERVYEALAGAEPGPGPGEEQPGGREPQPAAQRDRSGQDLPDLRGLVLVDLPDHDSAVTGHREQVDRLLGLVDAVVWVVDPEKYADAVLHERYLRPLAGYDEVTFVVLNQTDRLPGETADQVLHDLRRLLDEDGLALGEHGDPGAAVLALSALTGDGVGELREQLARFARERGAAERRLEADVDGAVGRLRPVCLAEGWAGLSARAREEFENRLAESVGAVAAGQAAEREWLRQAELAYGAPWAQLRGWCRRRRELKRQPSEEAQEAAAGGMSEAAGSGELPWSVRADDDPGGALDSGPEPRTARAMVEQAVRAVADHAATGLPDPWARAVRDSAACGAGQLPEALDEAAAVRAADSGRPTGPGWWAVASVAQGLLLALQVGAAIWLVLTVMAGPGGDWQSPAVLMAAGVAGGPALSWGCRLAARGPARAYGREAERRLRDAAAACGRSRVLEPVAAELLRYREARAQYTIAAGGAHRL